MDSQTFMKYQVNLSTWKLTIQGPVIYKQNSLIIAF